MDMKKSGNNYLLKLNYDELLVLEDILANAYPNTRNIVDTSKIEELGSLIARYKKD